METIRVGDVACTRTGCCGTEQAKDGVLNLVWVIEVENRTERGDEIVVRVFLGDLAFPGGDGRRQNGRGDKEGGEGREEHGLISRERTRR